MNGFYHKASEITNYRGELVFFAVVETKRGPETGAAFIPVSGPYLHFFRHCTGRMISVF